MANGDCGTVAARQLDGTISPMEALEAVRGDCPDLEILIDGGFRRGTLPKVAVGALILIPLLYGALYLWAFWDPTGNMDHLPVALVNEDVAAQRDGETVDAGTQVAEESIQLHGGIGMTWELPLSHYAKRLVMVDHELGDEDHHLARFIALSRERETRA